MRLSDSEVYRILRKFFNLADSTQAEFLIDIYIHQNRRSYRLTSTKSQDLMESIDRFEHVRKITEKHD